MLEFGGPASLLMLPHELTAHVNPNGALRVFDYQQGSCAMNISVQSIMPQWLKLAVEWNIVGRDAPYYGLGFGLTSCLHKGKTAASPEAAKACGDAKTLPESISQNFVANSMGYVERINSDMGGWLKLMRRERALEFGCGLGRLALGWMTQFEEVDCVDQSIYHQELATRPLLTRFSKELVQKHPEAGPLGMVNLLVTTPDVLRTADGHRYDFVHSVKVFQHILPMHQHIYLEQMCDVLREGGKGWLHYQDGLQAAKRRVRDDSCDSVLYKAGATLDEHEHKRPENAWDRHGVMGTYDFDTRRLRTLLLQRGCTVESIQPVKDGPHGLRVIFIKKATPAMHV